MSAKDQYSERKHILAILSIATIIAFSTFLRTWDLGEESLWSDEAYTAVTADPDNILGIFGAKLRDRYNPPVYFLAAAVWTKIAGVNEFHLRFPAAVFGSLLVPAAMWLAWNISRRFLLVLFGGFLTSLSWFFVEYAQEARSYSLLLLLAILHVGMFLLMLERPTKVRWIGFTITGILGVYTHFAFWSFIGIDIGILALCCIRARSIRHFRSPLLSIAVTVASYLPWLIASTLPDVIQGYNAPWQGGYTIKDILAFFEKIFFVADLPQAVSTSIVLIILGGIAWFIVSLFRTRDPRLTPALIFVGYILAPFMFFAIPNLWVDRYVLIAVPFLYILLGWALLSLPRLFSLPLFIPLLVVLIGAFALSVPWYKTYYQQVQKEPWREITAWVEARDGGDGMIIVNKEYSKYPWQYYYRGRSTALFPEKITGEDFQNNVDKFSNSPFVVIVYLYPKDPGRVLVRAAEQVYTYKEVRRQGAIEALYFSAPRQ